MIPQRKLKEHKRDRYFMKQRDEIKSKLNLFWQTARVYVTLISLTRNVREGENLQLTWHPSQGQQNLSFLRDYQLLQCFYLRLWKP